MKNLFICKFNKFHWKNEPNSHTFLPLVFPYLLQLNFQVRVFWELFFFFLSFFSPPQLLAWQFWRQELLWNRCFLTAETVGMYPYLIQYEILIMAMFDSQETQLVPKPGLHLCLVTTFFQMFTNLWKNTLGVKLPRNISASLTMFIEFFYVAR